MSNAVAGVVVSIWEGACDRKVLAQELDQGCFATKEALEADDLVLSAPAAAATAAAIHLHCAEAAAGCSLMARARCLKHHGFASSTLTPLPFGASRMPAMSTMDLVLALTTMVPSGITGQSRRLPGLACTSARMSAGTVVWPF